MPVSAMVYFSWYRGNRSVIFYYSNGFVAFFDCEMWFSFPLCILSFSLYFTVLSWEFVFWLRLWWIWMCVRICGCFGVYLWLFWIWEVSDVLFCYWKIGGEVYAQFESLVFKLLVRELSSSSILLNWPKLTSSLLDNFCLGDILSVDYHREVFCVISNNVILFYMSLIYWKRFLTFLVLQIKSHTDWIALGRLKYSKCYVDASVGSICVLLVIYNTNLVCLDLFWWFSLILISWACFCFCVSEVVAHCVCSFCFLRAVISQKPGVVGDQKARVVGSWPVIQKGEWHSVWLALKDELFSSFLAGGLYTSFQDCAAFLKLEGTCSAGFADGTPWFLNFLIKICH